MPRPTRVPKYGLHKASGQARVTIDGKHLYLGVHGSPESLEKFARVVAERFTSDDLPTVKLDGRHYPDCIIAEIMVRFLEHRKTVDAEDKARVVYALRPLRQLYSSLPARDFGPRNLKALQQYMVETEQLARTEINRRIQKIRKMFKWAVSEELIPPSVFQALQTVEGLRYGQTDARETEPIRPVPDEAVDATHPYLPPHVADMVRVHRLTGMRPQDVVKIRAADIDRTGEVWIYEPLEHKSKWRGHTRQIPIGPKAQAVIEPYLEDRPAEAYLFSPAEVVAWRREQRREQPSARKTKVYPCERKRLARERKARRRGSKRKNRAPRDRYDTESYNRAIQNAIAKARKAGVEIPSWSPNLLRHTRATEIRRQHGVEAAQVVLGHAKADVTQIYAERNLNRAMQVVRETG